MKIDSIETIPYNLSLKESFVTSKNTYSNREGYIIKVASNEFVGFGDVCPLPKFNCENIKDTLYGLEKFKSAVLGVGELDENDDLGKCPSLSYLFQGENFADFESCQLVIDLGIDSKSPKFKVN